MGFFSLVLVNLGRNKRRTILTVLSVVVALFLFCGLRGVLDTLDASIKVGSETRLVTRNRISLIFPLPLSYHDRSAGFPGGKKMASANGFGGRAPVDPKNWYAQFAGDENSLPLYRSDYDIIAYDPPQAGAALPPGADVTLASYDL